jgi:hypothetical protein
VGLEASPIIYMSNIDDCMTAAKVIDMNKKYGCEP